MVLVPWAMKLVRTALSDDEYLLLRQRAAKEGKSMKTVTREALRAHLMPDRVNPEDPVFHAFPLIRSKGKTTWDSRNHDEILHPKSR
jgi:plasmid stability protein